VGISIGKYKLIKRIAVGGMAEIFLASIQGEAGFERYVIIKKILPHYAGEPEFVRRLVDEGLLASRLHHGNIVQVMDLGRLGPDYFIAMEFVDGVDLRELLAVARELNFQVPIPIGIHILWQVSRALSYAHDKKSARAEPLNIVHRDISPANIFISWEGAVKLGDFGIAKASQRVSSQTMTGVLHGKFPYMSPEQAEGEPQTQGSDIFSFGVVAYELMTRMRPFEGESDLQILSRIRESVPEPLRDHRPELPLKFEVVVNNCLEKRPEDRYARGAELEKALATLMQQQAWVVSEADVADFLEALYGRRKRSLADELESLPDQELQVVEASPLDPYDLRAGLPGPVLTPHPARSQPELTKAATAPSWQRRRRLRNLVWLGWIVFMAAAAGFLLGDYFSWHLLFGPGQHDGQPGGPVSDEARIGPSRHRLDSDDGPQSAATTGPMPDIFSPRDHGRSPAPRVPPRDAIESARPAEVSTAPRDQVTAEAPRDAPRPADVLQPGSRTPDVRNRELPDSAGPRTDTVVDDRPLKTVTRLQVIPTDTLVHVNGRLLGEQPRRLVVMDRKPLRVRLERDGYQPSQFELSYPSPRKLSKRLQPLERGRLILRYFPAAAEVYVDGVRHYSSDSMNIIEAQLPVGPHRVRIRHLDRETSRDIEIKKDKEWRGTISIDP